MTIPLCLTQQSKAIMKAADERGIAVFVADTLFEGLECVQWNGEWLPFIEIAKKTGITLIYLNVSPYDVSLHINGAIHHLCSTRRRATAEFNLALNMLTQKLQERTKSWETYSGQPGELICAWVRDGICHNYSTVDNRATECSAAIAEVISEFQAENGNEEDYSPSNLHHNLLEEQRIHDESERCRIHELAVEMTQHPRYRYATSETKRSYMAQQLFPNEPGYVCRRIAEVAYSFLWWHSDKGIAAIENQKSFEL